MEKIFNILEYNPILTLIFGFILAVLAMILFREEIKSYIKKKYDLYDEQQVLNLMREAVKVFEATNLMNPHKVIEDEKRQKNK